MLCSHQQASLGKLPRDTSGLVIVDESHHFRNRLTKRYANTAIWLVGRPVLLATATPLVNDLVELGNQLLLAVRDNALALDGIASLRALLAGDRGHPALGQLVVEQDAAGMERPRKLRTISPATQEECVALTAAAELIGRLSLSHSESVSVLLRTVLLRAAGSSPAALAGSLQRYRRLLLHARDALHAGLVLDRSQLRRLTEGLSEQLLWWELLPGDGGASDLELGDLPVLDEILPVVAAATRSVDAKLDRLRTLLTEEKPTLVFTASRDTVRYIRERLDDINLAWCTGDAAGIRRYRLPRDTVLGWFREDGLTDARWCHLIVTDVAAEGLDLQRAARVIHYDLPWTPTRLEQREGRSARLGSRYREIDVIRFAPPPSLEQSLHLEAILTRKARLPAAVGLGAAGRHLWRWRSALSGELRREDALAGVAWVPSPYQGLLAGIALHHSQDPAALVSTVAGWLDPAGNWTEDPAVVADRMRQAAHQHRRLPVPHDRLRGYLDLLTPLIRSRLALTRGSRWLAPEPPYAVRCITARLSELIGQAARLRMESRLSELEHGLRSVAGGHTAGEEMLLDRLVEAPDRELMNGLRRIAPQATWDGIEVRLTGLIVFGE